MSRPLRALAVIAAASVVGVWIQAATHRVSHPVPTQAPTALIGRADVIPAAAIQSHAAPTRDSKSPATAKVAGGDSRSPITSLDAEPGRATPSMAKPRLGAAMRIAADPATGQLVAPEHSGLVLTIEAMQDLARQEAVGLVTIKNPDGSETLNHEGRFTDYSLIRVGPDGGRMFQCLHGPLGMDHALRHATPNLEDR